MARRPGPIKAFVRRATETEVSDNESTARKRVWTPPPSIHTLVVKVDRLEERLNDMETFLRNHLDMDVRQERVTAQQEEVHQARQELQEIKQQLDGAVQRLQQREADLQNTQNALDNLTNQTAMDRDKIHALEVEKKGLQQLVQDLEIKLNERVKKIGDLESQVSRMKRTLDNTNKTVGSLKQQMEQMQEQMTSFMAGYPVVASPQPARAISPARSTVTVGNSSQQRDKIIAQAASSRCQKITSELPPIPLNSHLAGPRASTRDSRKFNFPPK